MRRPRKPSSHKIEVKEGECVVSVEAPTKEAAVATLRETFKMLHLQTRGEAL